MRRILIVDDEREMRESFAALVSSAGWEVVEAADGFEAVRAVEESVPHAVLLDLIMPGKEGQEVLDEIRFLEPDLPVIILSGHGNIERAVRAIKSGAFDFLTKPPDPDHLLLVLERAVERRTLEREVRQLRRRQADIFTCVGGQAPSMKEFMESMERVAATESTVLLTGETGTGKELAARDIWQKGPRSGSTFVVVNCATLSDTLLESDLFGHEKGAFTGATSTKLGRLEEADRGTLFLDEIGELPLPIQAKFLRVLEYGEFQRVGSTKTRHADVRVIAATNRDLDQEVAENRFRTDLYHRLSVVTLNLPPLRERMEDLPLIVDHHLKRLCLELGRPEPEIPEQVWQRMREYDWPGNVREVRNILERALVLSPTGAIGADDVPAPGPAAAVSGDEVEVPVGTPLVDALEQYKRWMVKRTLQACGGNQTKAAELLGMHRSSLNRLMKDLDLR